MAHAALGIECPTCTVGVGEECITVQFDAPKPRPPHAKRMEVAKEKGLSRSSTPSASAAPRKRAEIKQEYPADYSGPWVADYIMYHDPDAKTQGHTGRVMWVDFQNREDVYVGLRPTPSIGEDISWENEHENDTAIGGMFVDGWWPDDMEESRSEKNMRKIARWY